MRISRAATLCLWALVVAVAAATAAGTVFLWPRDVPPTRVAVGAGYDTRDVVPATVLSAGRRTCPGLSEDRLPNGDVPASVTCGELGVRLGAGPEEGLRTTVAVDGPLIETGIGPGDRVDVVRLAPEDLGADAGGTDGGADAGAGAGGTGGDDRAVAPPTTTAPSGPGVARDVYVFSDFSRALPLQVLGIGFVVLVVAVARLRGLAALAGLGLGYLTVLQFMLPALRAGSDPTLVALVGSVGIMVVILYVAHGVSAKTTAALLGTVAGLVITALLSRWAVGSAHLTGMNNEDSRTLTQLVGPGILPGVVTCGMILAGLGVLNDVTVTQASAVWELRAHAPHLGPLRLFASGMRIGRDHLASAVYTIAFAYAGAALPAVLLIQLYDRPLGRVLTSGEVAEEVARTLVGGIGLVLAIPLTTALAVAVVATARRPPAGDGGDAREIAEAADRRAARRRGEREALAGTD